MTFLTLLEITGFILLWVPLLSQLIVPLWTNQPIFPLFRKKPPVLQTEETPEEAETDNSSAEQIKARLLHTAVINKLKRNIKSKPKR